MPDPITGLVAGGGSLLSSVVGSKGAKSAGRAQAGAADRGIEEQRAARESFEQRTQPFADVGLSAAGPLQELLGLSGGDPQSTIEEINPVLSFLRNEGFEDIQESAAARGRLGAGGTLKDLTEFNTNLSSTIVPQLQNQRFNQLFNVLGLGANTATGQGTAGLNTASNIGNLLGSQGNALAQAKLGQAGAIQGGISDLTGLFGFGQGSGGAFNFLNSGGTTAGAPAFRGSPDADIFLRQFGG